MAKYEILSLDVWGNPRDGYEVNQMFNTGIEVDIPDFANDEEALKLIRGKLGHPRSARGYHDPYQHETEYFFVRNKDGKPSYVAQMK